MQVGYECCGNAYLYAYVDKNSDHAQREMTESPRATLVHHFVRYRLWLGQRGETNHDIYERKYSHRDIEHDVDIIDFLAFQRLAYDSTYQHRCQRTGERVERTADQVQLVTLVATTAQQVEHRVGDGIEHTYAEAAYQCAAQVDSKAVGHAACPLDSDTDQSQQDSCQGCLLVAVFCQEITGRNTHD